jgi:hypothetical protein
MSTTRRVRVITEGNRLVGIFAASPRQPGTQSGAPVAQLRAGPGQKEHDIEIDWPTEVEGTVLAETLHTRAKKALRLA